MNSHQGSLKLLILAILWFCGLGLIAVSFVKAPALKYAMRGSFCILVAIVWMYWDYKRRLLTPDEELEQLLLDVARRYRHTRSLDAIAEEYRGRGATEDTLDFIRSVPRMLKTRADAKIHLGRQLLVLGIIITVGTWWLSRITGFMHYEVAVGAIGGGVGFIIIGLRQQRAFPNGKILRY